jgi:hypothetical protein
MVEIFVRVKSVPVVSDNVAQSMSSLPVTVKLIGADDDVAAERASVTVGGVVSGGVVVVVDGATVVVVDGGATVVVVDGATVVVVDGATVVVVDGATVVVVVDGATVVVGSVVVVVDGATVVVGSVVVVVVDGATVVVGSVVVVDSKRVDALPRSPNCIPLAATTVPPANTVQASAKAFQRKKKDSTIRRYEEPCTR